MYKYVLRNSLYLDEELQEYFNEMSKKGWRLDFIGYYYRFSHDEHVYKYQIDYTPSSSEYNEVLKEMGYEEVNNSFDDFRVLENENVDAPDLNTEFVFDKNNKIKQFKKMRYFVYPILACFLFWIGKLFLTDFFEIGFPIVYYEGFTKYLILLMVFILAIGILLSSILNFSILYALKHDKDLKILKKLNEIKDYADVEKNYTYRDRLRSFNVGHSAIYAGGIASEQKINPKLKMEYAAIAAEGDHLLNSISTLHQDTLLSDDASIDVVKRSLEGTVWIDKDKDGKLEDGEKRVENVKVIILKKNGDC